MYKIKPVFNMTWLMEISNIYLKEKLLIKYYDKAFDIAKNPKYDGYKQGFTSNIFDKKLQVVHLLKVKM